MLSLNRNPYKPGLCIEVLWIDGWKCCDRRLLGTQPCISLGSSHLVFANSVFTVTYRTELLQIIRLDCSCVYYKQIKLRVKHMGSRIRQYEFRSHAYHVPHGGVWASISSLAKGPHSWLWCHLKKIGVPTHTQKTLRIISFRQQALSYISCHKCLLFL